MLHFFKMIALAQGVFAENWSEISPFVPRIKNVTFKKIVAVLYWVFAQFLSKISPFVIIYLDLGRILIYDKNDHQGDSNPLSHASRTGLQSNAPCFQYLTCVGYQQTLLEVRDSNLRPQGIATATDWCATHTYATLLLGFAGALPNRPGSGWLDIYLTPYDLFICCDGWVVVLVVVVVVVGPWGVFLLRFTFFLLV